MVVLVKLVVLVELGLFMELGLYLELSPLHVAEPPGRAELSSVVNLFT